MFSVPNGLRGCRRVGVGTGSFVIVVAVLLQQPLLRGRRFPLLPYHRRLLQVIFHRLNPCLLLLLLLLLLLFDLVDWA